MCLKELMLIRQVYQKNVILVIFLDNGFKFQRYVYNGCHDLTQKAISPDEVAIVTVNGYDHRNHFGYYILIYIIYICIIYIHIRIIYIY